MVERGLGMCTQFNIQLLPADAAGELEIFRLNRNSLGIAPRAVPDVTEPRVDKLKIDGCKGAGFWARFLG